MVDETIAVEPVRATPPWVFAFCSTGGLHTGFVTVVIPFVASHNDMSAAAFGSIVAAGMLASPMKIFWTPVVDLVWTLRGWVVASMVALALLLVVLALVPFDPRYTLVLVTLAFLSGVAAQTGTIAISGLFALTVEDKRLATASGYFSGGGLAVTGFGGALGLWLAVHVGMVATAIAMGLAALIPAAAMLLIHEPYRPHLTQKGFVRRIRSVGLDLIDMARSRRRLFVIVAFLTPIGVGGAANLFSGVAQEWHAGADLVAAVTGLGAAFASAAEAFVYGRFVDRFDRVASFLTTGVVMVVAAVALALLPRTPLVFAVATIFYAFSIGFCWTSFVALQFETVGKGAAASKAGILNAVGNVPVAYMPALLGLVHDRYSTTTMWFEAVLSAAFILAFALARPRTAYDRGIAAAQPAAA